MVMISMNVRDALNEYPNAQVGWWTSADRSGCLDMVGATVAEAVAEILAQCGDDEEERADVYAGTLEVEIGG